MLRNKTAGNDDRDQYGLALFWITFTRDFHLEETELLDKLETSST